MPRETTKLGNTVASLINTLSGGRNYQKYFDAGASAQSLADLRAAQRGKYTAETQKLMDQLSANAAARKMTPGDLGMAYGYTPENVAQYEDKVRYGKFTRPFEPDMFPGEEAIPGLKTLTDTRPADFTPQKERAIQSVMQMLALNKLTGGRSNAAQLATGAKTQNIERLAATLLTGPATVKNVARARAAAEGKDMPDMTPDVSGKPSAFIEKLRILMAPTEKGGLGKTREEAMGILLPGLNTPEKLRASIAKALAQSGAYDAKQALSFADKVVSEMFNTAPQIPDSEIIADYTK